MTKQTAAKLVGELDQRRLIEREAVAGRRPGHAPASLSRRGRALVAAAGLRTGLERLVSEPPWDVGAGVRSRRVW